MRGSGQPLIFRRSAPADGDLRFSQSVPEAYGRAAYHELLHLDRDGDAWQQYWRARAQMALDEFLALPLLEETYQAFENAADAVGCGLTARTALIALNYGEATSAGLHSWTERMSSAAAVPVAESNALAPATRAWWLAGELARVYAAAATDYLAPGTLAARDALLGLALDPHGALDDDALLVAAMTLFEYAEFEDDEALFDRVLSGVAAALEDKRGSPLYRGRVWHRIHRCAFSLGPARRRARQRIDVALAEEEALAISVRHALPHLEAAVLAVRGFYANVRRDSELADAVCERLGRITDFQRPMAAAWYYFLRAQTCARAEALTEALLFFAQAAEAARRAEAAPASQQTFLIGHAGMLSQLGHWNEADAIYADLIRHQSGRDRDITECRRQIVAVQRAAVQEPERFVALRHALLERARELRYLSFYLTTPRTTADFLADALRSGEAADFIAEIVRTRQLPARDSYSRQWPWLVRIEALGGLHVSIDGQAVSFGARPQKKPIDLLKLLVAQGPAPVASTTVIDALWPEADGANAKGSFDMALLRLRKLLGREDIVRLEAGRVGFDRERVWVDAWAFVADASASYTGPLFGHEAPEPWWSVSRARLHERYLRRAQEQAERLEGEERPADALALYEAALEHEPLAEVMSRGAMRCHIAMGEPALAMRTFERCRERLTAALGVAPSLATRKLAETLRVG
jgi:DNA-binding SARP family transcriptional activator